MPGNSLLDNFKETEIGPIPVDWDVIPLRDLATEFFSGGTPSTKRPEFWDGNIPWTTSAYIDGLYLDEGAKYITSQGLERSSSKLVPRGNLLIGTRVGVGKVAITSIDIAISQDLTGAIVDRTKAHPEFLAYVTQSDGVQELIRLSSRGTTIKGIAREDLVRIPIPLPPLPEQRRIAHVLSTIQRAIAAQDDLIAAAREVKRSLMQRLFTYGPGPEPAPTKETEIGEIPEHWKVVRFRDWTTLVTKGSSPKWQGFDYCEKGIAFVRSQNVGLGILDLTDTAYLPEEFNEKHRTSIVKKDDLLINIVGASIGRAALADEHVEGANLNQAVALVRLKKGIDPRFAMHFLLTESGLDQIHRQKKEIARANISLQDIKNFHLPFPPLHEQQEIAHVLLAADQKIAAEEQRKAALQALFQAMLHQLMTGQVRTPDTVEVPQ